MLSIKTEQIYIYREMYITGWYFEWTETGPSMELEQNLFKWSEKDVYPSPYILNTNNCSQSDWWPAMYTSLYLLTNTMCNPVIPEPQGVKVNHYLLCGSW